ncbi:MAG: Hsp20/alpha crystallin family protein [Candidatus Cloacimonadia bacterium]|jgi:HSP20 family molecular chaperone IbpA
MNKSIFDDMLELQREMMRLMNEVATFPSKTLNLSQISSNQWQPRCDVYRTSSQLIIIFDLAGVNKESIKIYSQKDFLTVSGERVMSTVGDAPSFYTMEIDSGHFERRVFLPDLPIAYEKLEVSYENGLLKITFDILPSKDRVIEIEIR